MFGDFFCDFTTFGTQKTSQDSSKYADCSVSYFPTGFYNVSLTTVRAGKGFILNTAKTFFDLQGNPYSLVVIPSISSLSTNKVTKRGDIITISGKGFSNSLSENKVLFKDSECKVVYSSYFTIRCILYGLKDQTENKITASAGWRVKKFTNKKSIIQLQQTVGSRLNEGEDDMIFSGEIGYAANNKYSEVIEGFFRAPKTGNYTFLLSADQSAKVYLSATPLDKQKLNLIAEVKTGTEFRNFYNPTELNQVSKEIPLIADQFYFVRAFHLGGPNAHFTLGVKIPDNQRASNQQKVISIKVEANVVKERAIFTLKSTNKAVLLGIPKDFEVRTSRVLIYPTSEDELVKALEDLDLKARVISKKFLNLKGGIVNDRSASYVQYDVEFLEPKDPELLPIVSDPSLGSVQSNKDVNPTPLVSGSFKLSISGRLADINYDESANTIATKLGSGTDYGLNIRAFRYGDCYEGCQWIIYFDGDDDDLPVVGLDSTNTLKGGSTPVNVSIQILQEVRSQNSLFIPIPHNLMYTIENTSILTVSVNGILSSCPAGVCSLEVTDSSPYPSVSNFTLKDNIVSIQFISSVLVMKDQISKAFFAGSEATILSYDQNSQILQCIVPTNIDNSLSIVAGDHLPFVQLRESGLVDFSQGVIPITILPVINSVYIQAPSSGGYLQIIMGGNYFGFSFNYLYETQVTVGNIPCDLIQLNNTRLVCEIQTLITDNGLILKVNGASKTFPLVVRASKKIKVVDTTLDDSREGTVIRISGLNSDDLPIIVLQNQKTNKLSNCFFYDRSPGYIRCLAYKLTPGNYKLIATNFNNPYELNQQSATFKFVLNIVSIQPQFGSQLGGTLLTIKGGSFSSMIEKNQITIGPNNVVCQITDVSESEIKCITVSNSQGYIGSQLVNVFTFGTLAECSGDCTFTYSEKYTPAIYNVSQTLLRKDDKISFFGRSFSASVQIKLSGNIIKIINVSSQKIDAIVPDIQAGINLLLEATDPVSGNYIISPNINLTYPANIIDFFPKTGSIAGTLLTITGIGFSDQNEVLIGNQFCNITYIQPSKIICKAPSNSSGEIAIIQTDGKKITCPNCNFQSLEQFTPKIKVASFKLLSASTLAQLRIEGQRLAVSSPPDIQLISPTAVLRASINSLSDSVITAQFVYLPTEEYTLDVKIGPYFPIYEPSLNDIPVLEVPIFNKSVSFTQSSFAGGPLLEINGYGFPSKQELIDIRVAGLTCDVTSISYVKIQCKIPPLVTPETHQEFQIGQEKLLEQISIIVSSEAMASSPLIDDSETLILDYIDPNQCFYGIDVGEGLIAEVTRVLFDPETDNEQLQLTNSIFEGSNNGKDWTVIYDIRENFGRAFNDILPTKEERFRFFRFRTVSMVSQCNIISTRYFGILMSSTPVKNLTSVYTDLVLRYGGHTKTINNIVEYRKDLTPLVTRIDPSVGPISGGTTISIIGEKLSNLKSKPSVYIGQTGCDVIFANSSLIKCVTKPQSNNSVDQNIAVGNVIISVEGIGNAVSKVNFLYADRYSEIQGLGCNSVYICGNNINVPAGNSLIIDISPPPLSAMIIEGGVIVEDSNIQIQANSILIRNGFMRIGTTDQPIKNQVAITLTGKRNSDNLSIFGEQKFIGIYGGFLKVYGRPRIRTQTYLNQSIIVGDNILIVKDLLDISLGDEIIVSTTSNDTSQTERRRVVALSEQKIVVDRSFKYNHIMDQKLIAGETVEVKTIVSILSRNIIIQGDENSSENKYGGHILVWNPGNTKTSIKVSNVEFKNMGQAGIANKVPIALFHLEADSESYVLDNSIHNSYHRGIQVIGTSNVQINGNLLYDVEGHGISLLDGASRFNSLQDNTVILTKFTLPRYSTDKYPSGFLITNPSNNLIGNKVIGSQYNGFVLALSEDSVQLQITKPLCPQREALGIFEKNEASFNTGDGLYITEFDPRSFPCQDYGDFTKNPPVPGKISNFLGFMNMIIGIRIKNIGATTFENIRLIDNTNSGLRLENIVTNIAINSTVIKGGLIAGQSYLLDQSNSQNYIGISVPKSDGLYIEGTKFANFESDSTAISPCTDCELDSGIRTVFTTGLRFFSVFRKTNFSSPRSSIFRDLDGSLTGLQDGGTLVVDLPHLRTPQCISIKGVTGGLACNNQIEVRKIIFYNVLPQSLLGRDLNIQRVRPDFENTSDRASQISIISFKKGNDPLFSWGAPFVTGQAYQIYFDAKLDFRIVYIETSDFYQEQDEPILLYFNYTIPKEDYDVVKQTLQPPLKNMTDSTKQFTNPTDIRGIPAGKFYNDAKTKTFSLAITGIDPGILKIQAFDCKLNCMDSIPIITTNNDNSENFLRKWSYLLQWPQGRLPREGEDVLIPTDWVIILDIDPPSLGTLEIQGELRFDDTRPINTIRAQRIWVRGKLIAGSRQETFKNMIQIFLTGNRRDKQLVINPGVYVGTKVLAVTGELKLYGKELNTRVRLLDNAYPNSEKIIVDGNIEGWKKGDEVLIVGSQRNPFEQEIRTIAMVEEHIITLNQTLNYFHYGSKSQFSTPLGPLDLRTEILLLTRNIKIRGTEEDRWGSRVIATQELNAFAKRVGSIEMQYTSLEFCGHNQLDRAGLSFELMTNVSDSAKSVVKGSVIRDCITWGVKFFNSEKIDFINNIVLDTEQIGIIALGKNINITISNNIIIAPNIEIKEGLGLLQQVSAGIYMLTIEPDSVFIQNNIVAGCKVSCYTLNAPRCGQFNYFLNNIAHSGEVGYLALSSGNECINISNFAAYKNTFGVISYTQSSQINAFQLILTDNQASINLNLGEKPFSVKNCVFAAFSSVDCPNCIPKGEECSNNTGILLGVISINNSTTSSGNMDPINSDADEGSLANDNYIFSKNYFLNFRNGLLSQCNSNKIFRTTEIQTQSPSIVLVSNSQVYEIDRDSLIEFNSPSEKDKRCGQTPCTNLNNLLVRDLDGSLVQTAQQMATLLPNNPKLIYNDDNCSFYSQINGYICNSSRFGILALQINKDKSLKEPITSITISGPTEFENTINTFGSFDENGTLAFVSIVSINKSYNITFSSLHMPNQTEFTLKGNFDDSVVIQLNFGKNIIYQLKNKAKGLKPNLLLKLPDNNQNIQGKDPCGTYVLNVNEGFIQFKLTTKTDCVLEVETAELLVATIRYDITVQEFYRKGGLTPFMINLASTLSIAQERIEAIEIRNGSVILDFKISALSDIQESFQELLKLGTKLQYLIIKGDLKLYDANMLNYKIRIFGSENYEFSSDNNNEIGVLYQEGKEGLYFIIVGIPILLVVIIGMIYRRKRNKRRRAVVDIRAIRSVAPENPTLGNSTQN